MYEWTFIIQDESNNHSAKMFDRKMPRSTNQNQVLVTKQNANYSNLY